MKFEILLTVMFLLMLCNPAVACFEANETTAINKIAESSGISNDTLINILCGIVENKEQIENSNSILSDNSARIISSENDIVNINAVDDEYITEFWLNQSENISNSIEKDIDDYFSIKANELTNITILLLNNEIQDRDKRITGSFENIYEDYATLSYVNSQIENSKEEIVTVAIDQNKYYVWMWIGLCTVLIGIMVWLKKESIMQLVGMSNKLKHKYKNINPIGVTDLPTNDRIKIRNKKISVLKTIVFKAKAKDVVKTKVIENIYLNKYENQEEVKNSIKELSQEYKITGKFVD